MRERGQWNEERARDPILEAGRAGTAMAGGGGGEFDRLQRAAPGVVRLVHRSLPGAAARH